MKTYKQQEEKKYKRTNIYNVRNQNSGPDGAVLICERGDGDDHEMLFEGKWSVGGDRDGLYG